MPREGKLVLLLAGDVMTGRGIDQVQSYPGDPTLYEDGVRDARERVRLPEAVQGPIAAPVAPDSLRGDALAEMKGAAPDLRIVNLETAIARAGEPWPAKGIHYRMHPANVACLRAARPDACALANNPVLGWDRAGLLATLRTLRDAGLQTADAGANEAEAWAQARRPLPRSMPGRGQLLLFACAAASSGVAADRAAGRRRAGGALLPDLSAAAALQRAADSARQCRADDLVVQSIHRAGKGGREGPRAHRDFAQRPIDAGAVDLVHGRSSHHPLPLETHRGKPILHGGCGDLVNDYEGIDARGPLRSDVGCLYFATVRPGCGRLERLDIVPLRLQRFRFTAADAADAADAAVHDFVGQVFSAAAAGLGAQPARQRETACSLRAAAGS